MMVTCRSADKPAKGARRGTTAGRSQQHVTRSNSSTRRPQPRDDTSPSDAHSCHRQPVRTCSCRICAAVDHPPSRPSLPTDAVTKSVSLPMPHDVQQQSRRLQRPQHSHAASTHHTADRRDEQLEHSSRAATQHNDHRCGRMSRSVTAGVEPVGGTGLSPLLVMLLSTALLACWSLPVAAAASVGPTSATLFVGSGGLLVDAPLSLQGTDIGAAITSLQAQIHQQDAKLQLQADRIDALEADLATTHAIVAAQQTTIAALTANVDVINSTVTDISDLTGETTIVGVVNGLRRVTSQLSTDLAVLDNAVANQTTLLAAISSDLSDVESLTGDSTLVQTVNALSATTAGLKTTVTQIADLTGDSTIVQTVKSIVDSMTDQATQLATLQTLQTATTQMLTTLSQTVSSQVTLINNKIDANVAALQALITALQNRATADEILIANNAAAITALQNRATDDEALIANNAAAITALQNRATDDEVLIANNAAAITALQNRATHDEVLIANNAAAIVVLQNRATDDETLIANNAAAITALQTLTNTHTTQISNLQSLTNTHTTQIANLQALTTSQGNSISSLQSLTSTHTSQISSLQGTTATHTNQIASLQTTASNQGSSIGSLQSSTSSMSGTISSLSSSVSSLQAQVTTLYSGMPSGTLCGNSPTPFTDWRDDTYLDYNRCGGLKLACPSGWTQKRIYNWNEIEIWSCVKN